jgi:hypothetical protein
MSEFAKMDIFFVVTTITVIVVAFMLALALYYIIRILRNVEHVSEIVSEEGDRMREDIAQMRSSIKREGFKISHLASFARKRAASFMRGSKKSE